ncbi:Zn-ribbon domain-containing OB-fold protein [Blastococcus brunescens]|uniref:Zn-ribbon domain-containing OB-fold protein n=1 Tax=Blastococcus brunescens TaxID=1564165 RepID=A0ABZ1B082_9ACTN|nr:Zn-ribbon domain-containing OB-fold protein [Blastococcus sp. BMG 8361]WRL64222.1 Zn-ribbon domain-containing OB-fold protein [Blastococcus sp. BMG 8361]
MSDYSKPLPDIDDETRPFWDGALREELRMQKCSRCGHIRYPISRICPDCLEPGHEWVPLSGRGEVYSSIVFHQVYDKAFADDVPYNVSLVQLDEGPRMFSNVVGVPPSEVTVGARVRVVFDRVTEEVAIPRFTPEEQ